MYTPEFLKELEQQEKQLTFDRFDLEDAYALGTKLRKKAVEVPLSIAVRIVLNGLIVYQTFLPGTGMENDFWMNLKYATVAQSHKSSLRVAAERELLGIREPWQADENNHAFCGGGFPIIVNGIYSGAVIVSGLPHVQDHELVTDVIAGYIQERRSRDHAEISFIP